MAVTTTSHVFVVQNVASGDPNQKKNNPCHCVSFLKLILKAIVSTAVLISNKFEDCIYIWIYENSVKEILQSRQYKKN